MLHFAKTSVCHMKIAFSMSASLTFSWLHGSGDYKYKQHQDTPAMQHRTSVTFMWSYYRLQKLKLFSCVSPLFSWQLGCGPSQIQAARGHICDANTDKCCFYMTWRLYRNGNETKWSMKGLTLPDKRIMDVYKQIKLLKKIICLVHV